MQWGARRPTAVAALLYLVLAFALVSPGLVPGRTLSASDYFWIAAPWDTSRPAAVPPLGSNREQGDAVNKFQPSLEYTRHQLPGLSLWDPHVLSGRPYIADPQTQLWSPFSIPSYVLPFWKSLAVSAALKLFVAALGAFLLARALGMRFGGALMTGLAFGFSLWSVRWVSWSLESVWAFLPWVCLFAEMLVRRPAALAWSGLAVATGLQWFGGHPSSSFQVLVAISVFWGLRVLLSAELRQRFPLRLALLGSALAAGTALAAVALIPFAELLAHSGDVGTRSGVTQAFFRQPPHYLFGIFVHDWWGAGRTSYEFAATNQERAYYVGALPLMLAVAAVALRPNLARLGVLAAGALALSIATGQPPLFDLLTNLPGFEAANNSRFGVFAILGLAVLAGWGFDEITGDPLPEARRRLVLGLAAVLAAVPLVIAVAGGHIHLDVLGRALRSAWLFDSPDSGLIATPAGPFIVKLASLLEWAVMAGLALALLALALSRRVRPATFVALALVLVAFDLVKAGADYNPSIKQEYAVQPATPAIHYLQDRRPARFVGLEPTSLSLSPPLPPNLALRYGLYDARGDVIPGEERYTEIWRRAIGRNRQCYSFFCTIAAVASPESFRALGLFGVDYLLQNHGDKPLPGLQVAYQGDDARIYRNPSALPRAFVVGQQTVVEGANAQLDAVLAPGFEPRTTAVTERRLPGIAEGGDAGASPAGDARIEDYENDRVVIRARADRPGLVVLADSWYPGWKATVDGEDADVERVDYAVRGVAVGPGSHRVELTYAPASFRAGWIVSLLALLAIGGVAAAGLRSRRGPTPGV